jgi:hypothetical protein
VSSLDGLHAFNHRGNLVHPHRLPIGSKEHSMKKHMNSLKPQLETLEDRRVLSTTVSLIGRTVLVLGDANSDNVLVQPFFSSMDFVVNRGERHSIAQSKFDQVFVSLGDGVDTFRIINDHSPAWSSERRELDMKVDLGGDTDVAILFASAVAGLQDIDLDIDLRTGAGEDEVLVHVPKLFDSILDVDVDMGTETDRLSGFLSGRLFEQSKAILNARGNLGLDEMSFEGAFFAPPGSAVIDASSSLTVKYFGQRGADVMDMRLEPTFDSRFDGRVELYNHGGEGRDIITTNVSRDVNSDGDMILDVVGAKGNDRLTLNLNHTTFGTPPMMAFSFFGHIGGFDLDDLPVLTIPPTITAKIDGSVGFDFYAATPNVTVINCEGVIGGPFDIFLPPGDDSVLSR